MKNYILQSYEKNAVDAIKTNGHVILCEMGNSIAETIEMFRRNGLDVLAVKTKGYSIGFETYKYFIRP